MTKTNYSENIYWVYGILLDEKLPFDAKYVMEKLKEQGIGSRPFFFPMHRQPVFEKMGLFANEFYPISEKLAERGLYLPSGLNLKKEHIFTVVKKLKKILTESI